MDSYTADITDIIKEKYGSLNELINDFPHEEDVTHGNEESCIKEKSPGILLLANGANNNGMCDIIDTFSKEQANAHEILNTVPIKTENMPDGIFSDSAGYDNEFMDVNSHQSIYRMIRPKGSERESDGLKLILHICNLCGDVCRSAWKLITHTKKKHNQDRPYVCSVCGLQDHDKNAMKKHFNIHAPAARKPHKCTLCPSSFHAPSQLENHIEMHKGSRPFTCGLCNKDFTWSGGLKDHMKIHTGERPHACKFCGKTFADTSKLKNHQRIHTGERPHVCSYCGKGFIESGKLKRHIRTHTGEQPYKCDLCSKRFNVMSNLHKHMTIHSGEKPYVCEICGKGFSQNVNLKSHLKTHRGEKDPYKCKICGIRYGGISKSKIHVCVPKQSTTVQKEEGVKKKRLKTKPKSKMKIKYKKKDKLDNCIYAYVENSINQEADLPLGDVNDFSTVVSNQSEGSLDVKNENVQDQYFDEVKDDGFMMEIIQTESGEQNLPEVDNEMQGEITVNKGSLDVASIKGIQYNEVTADFKYIDSSENFGNNGLFEDLNSINESQNFFQHDKSVDLTSNPRNDSPNFRNVQTYDFDDLNNAYSSKNLVNNTPDMATDLNYMDGNLENNDMLENLNVANHNGNGCLNFRSNEDENNFTNGIEIIIKKEKIDDEYQIFKNEDNTELISNENRDKNILLNENNVVSRDVQFDDESKIADKRFDDINDEAVSATNKADGNDEVKASTHFPVDIQDIKKEAEGSDEIEATNFPLDINKEAEDAIPNDYSYSNEQNPQQNFSLINSDVKKENEDMEDAITNTDSNEENHQNNFSLDIVNIKKENEDAITNTGAYYNEENPQQNFSMDIVNIKKECNDVITYTCSNQGISPQNVSLNITDIEKEAEEMVRKTDLSNKKCKKTLAVEFPCKWCDRICSDRTKLRKHVKTHSEVRPHVCKFCGKGFKESSKLKLHLRTHTKEQPYSCIVCGKKFSVHCNLLKHMAIHNQEKPYVCVVCGHGFTQNINLKAHMRIHTGEKSPYKCEVCKIRFSLIEDARTHECVGPIPAKQKPLNCSLCNKTFVMVRSLEKHIESHKNKKEEEEPKSTENLFECGVCDRKYSSSRSLKTHMRVHTGGPL